MFYALRVLLDMYLTFNCVYVYSCDDPNMYMDVIGEVTQHSLGLIVTFAAVCGLTSSSALVGR